MTDSPRQIIAQIALFADLPEPTLQALTTLAVSTKRAAGVTIQLQGEPAEAMYLVASGRVKIYRLSSGGREQILNVIGPTGMFNAVPIFDGGVCPASAETLGEVSLLVLPRQPLLECIDRHPLLARAFLAEFTARMRHLVDLVDTLALHTVQGRLARLLLEQAAAAERGEAIASITQAQMAAHLGTVREMVGRTLKSFEELGLIRVDRSTISVIDREGLERQAEL
ncbi:Crp/Fnr family transcriptional regulator [Candidatus Gracilibacteria bacterium]|nr:Crp/Fnr family transcriptional regulator [Candidatus Gracilibacteria bacterium]